MLVRTRRAGTKLALAAALGVGVLGISAGSAGAAPMNGLTGSFWGCSDGLTGTFVINSGNSHAAQTWNVAHLTFTTGGTGIFVPTALDLSFNGMSGGLVTKGSAPGDVTCSILASQGGFTLSGMVTGRVVLDG